MRLKGKKHNRKNRSLGIIIPAVIALAGIALLLGLGDRASGSEHFFCDMERTVDGGKKFRSDGHDFGKGETQSDEYAFSGKHSARCDEKNKYGPGVTLRNIFSGDVIKAQVWRKSEFGFGTLAIQGTDGWKFYTNSKEPNKIVKGWELIVVEVTVPLGVENKSLKVFPYATKGVVYFDNLKVTQNKNTNPNTSPSADYVSEKLNLEVDQKSFERFQKKRAEALSSAVLTAGDADLEKGKLHTSDGEIDVQARLKGDLTDHLEGSKWSFRILAEDKKAWRGMPEFSVHNSLSRSHLDEWVYHQILEREDVLTTRYDFVEMSLNGKTLGIYAYEEHFTPALLRHRKRQVAPIVRWNEDGLWNNAGKNFGKRPPWFESAQIQAYGGKEVLKNNEQAAYFETARNLLASAVDGTKKPSEIFDLDRLASFLAVTDLCLAHHSLNQTNMRFYFDPVTAKLEPIGYDGYTPNGTRFYKLPMLTGSKINALTPWHFSSSNDYNPLHHLLFNDMEFAKKYAAAVERVTAPAFLDTLNFELQKEIEAREKTIKREYTEYDFDLEYLTRNATSIQLVLYPIDNISLKAYHANGKMTLESYHSLPLEIIGFGGNEITSRPTDPLILESYNSQTPLRQYEFPLNKKVKNVFCKTLGTSQLFKIPVMKWAAPKPSTPTPTEVRRGNFLDFDFIRTTPDGAQIMMAPGRHVLEKDLLIPAGHSLSIQAGTDIILENGAAIVSHSPLFMMGSAERPIRVTSERRTGEGILVLGAEEESIFHHVIFENLNAIDRKGQRTEAALTFYESKASIKNCRFSNMQSKDALGFIRSQYNLEDCRFENVSADGVDADFSIGNIVNLAFGKVGKDAIEISGGTADIGQVEVVEAFGAGLNANHHARVSIQKLTVEKSKKGVEATDLSEIKIELLTLNTVNQGVLAFQKMPEFGGAKVEISKMKAVDVPELVLEEEGSSIEIQDK